MKKRNDKWDSNFIYDPSSIFDRVYPRRKLNIDIFSGRKDVLKALSTAQTLFRLCKNHIAVKDNSRG